MTNYTNCSDREKLEILFNRNDPSQVKQSKLLLILNSVWKYIVTVLTKEQELQIWQTSDRSGKTWWHGYDPVTGSSVCKDSEAEMRIWLEKRYYQ